MMYNLITKFVYFCYLFRMFWICTSFLLLLVLKKEEKKYQEKKKIKRVTKLFEFIMPLCGIVLQRKQLQAFGLYAHIAHNCNEVAVIDVELSDFA